MVDNDADIDPTKPLLTEWLAELCSGRRVVVFGCGDGAVAAGIAARAHVVVAFDPNPDQAAATRSHWRGLTNLFVGAGAPGRVDLSAHAPELVVDLSGPVGGEDLQRLVASASPILGEGGILVVEVAEAEADSVQTSFRHLRSVRVWVHQASVIGEEPMPAISLEEAAPTRILQVASNQPIPALPSSSNLEPVAASAAADLARIERLERELREARRRYDRLRSRRLVRASLALASVARPAVELARRFRTNPTDGGTGSEAPSESPLRTRAEVEHGIRRLRPGAGPTEGPLVSLVVLTRDGRHHLERLFAGLENSTAYRSFEVVVVDNASSDGTDELLARRWTFPVRVLKNEANTSFAGGSNKGVEAAAGELVLLLNNDVEPINSGWLGSMVQSLTDGVAAVGALLVYPDAVGGRAPGGPPLTVQHRGIGFYWRDGAPAGRNLGSGEDPLDPDLAATRAVPAATAACLLLRRSDYVGVGGLDEGYVYGWEDVDFCLRLRQQLGRILVCGGTALWHHEFGTQATLQLGNRSRNYQRNSRRFNETWAPALTRTLRLDALAGGGAWTGRPRRCVAITLTHNDPTKGWGDWYTAHELGDAFAAQGWEVTYAERIGDAWYDLNGEVDLVISLLDAYDVRRAPESAFTVAWVRNWTERWLGQPWFPHFHSVMASSRVSAELIRRGSEHEPEILPLATNPERFFSRPADPSLACDYAFVGNHWGVGRGLVERLDVHPDETFLVFGRGWEAEPRVARYWRGALSYEQLPDLYSSAGIVLDDTAGPTLPYGAVNARVFDALASGALVITDNRAGSEELFDGELPTATTRTELRAQLDRFLGDEPARRATAERLRRRVLNEHTYPRRARQLVEVAERRVRAPRVAIRIGPPDHVEAESWGDTHFARHFAGALRWRGYSTAVHILPEWELPSSQDADVVVHIRGLTTYAPKRAHVNVLWVISHPEDVAARECDKYDLVLAASPTFAEHLRPLTTRPVEVMLQAYDPARFHPTQPDPELRAELVFVGNTRGQDRDAVGWASKLGIDLAVYGAGWGDRIGQEFLRADYFPNDRLGTLYGSADIVLSDHWEDMRRHGFVSNRVFEALASGGFVISDAVAGIDQLFQGTVPTFSDRDTFAELIAHYLTHPEERSELALRGRELVEQQHTFDHRATQFDNLVKPLLAQRNMELETSGTGARQEPKSILRTALASPEGK